MYSYGIFESFLATTAAATATVGTAVDDSAVFDIAAIAEARLIVAKYVDNVSRHIWPVMFTAGNLTVSINLMPLSAPALCISGTIIATHINTSII